MLWPSIDSDSVKRGYCCPAYVLLGETGSVVVASLINKIILSTTTTMAIDVIFDLDTTLDTTQLDLKFSLRHYFETTSGQSSQSYTGALNSGMVASANVDSKPASRLTKVRRTNDDRAK